MKYQMLFIPIWIIDCSHIDKNNSDVFIAYGGHSDLDRVVKTEVQKEEKAVTKEEKEAKVDQAAEPVGTEGVVFIPNDKPIFRNEEIRVDDVINTRRISDLVKDDVKIVNEQPNQDILFVSGKNNENIEKAEVARNEKPHQDAKSSKKSIKKAKILDCNHLDCNNTENAVCGGKEENKQWKYRLFLNECFFRKVNCAFQNAVNRYSVVEMENCKNIGAHYVSRPYVYKPVPIPESSMKKPVEYEMRRSFSSRRSLNMGVDGTFCSHACPSSCTEDYDPQCAVSNSGVRKVFLNHCKLDYNSCLYKVVWHRRPLSECVGGRKADMTQNRGFIGWMQRVGIVDRKGRLVLS